MPNHADQTAPSAAVGTRVACPLLRGYIHVLGAIVSPLALAALIMIADSPRAIVGAAVFGTAIVLLHVTSANYHVFRWERLRRLDHAMIYVLIAGTFTPFTLGALGTAWGISVLASVWALAGAGVALAMLGDGTSRWLRVGLYLALGWLGVVPLHQLMNSLPGTALGLMLVGGGVYSLGGVVYATRRPDPLPAVFGYHEVFHSLTIAATVVFYLVVARYIVTR